MTGYVAKTADVGLMTLCRAKIATQGIASHHINIFAMVEKVAFFQGFVKVKEIKEMFVTAQKNRR